MMTCRSDVQDIAFPEHTGIQHLFARHDLADAYSAELPDEASRDAEQIARFMFEQKVSWASALMGARDAIMKPFGIKTTDSLQKATGGRIGIFKIYAIQPDEIVLGEDDHHLDFRISVLVRPRATSAGHQHEVVVSTVVHCHNRLGRVYLAVITPFHRLIVRALLQRAAREGWPRNAQSCTN